jgi:hypothetical protein
MGSLIQTKGTQRLANLFNSLFNDSGTGLQAARNATNLLPGGATTSLSAAFGATAGDLLSISDAFVAQFAGANWPAINPGDDLLYPGATLQATNVANNVVTFRLPNGVNTVPTSIAKNSAVCCLDRRKALPHGTQADTPSAVAGGAGGTFTVALLDKGGTALPNAKVKINAPDKICFTTGAHDNLVRRWRWYLQYDLKLENHTSIKRAISAALGDTTFQKITFQTLEDRQRVLTTPTTLLDGDQEFGNSYIMQIILFTEPTTAPDPLDPQ